MSDSRPKEMMQGYAIKESTVFENNRGFALAENQNAPQTFVTRQFTGAENGERDYYLGHYTTDGETARRDYLARVADYIKDYGQSERGVYKCCSTQRPVGIGTFPKTDGGPVRIVNFDTREGVELGHCRARGYLEHSAPLTEKQLDDCGLKAAHNNPDLKRCGGTDADRGRICGQAQGPRSFALYGMGAGQRGVYKEAICHAGADGGAACPCCHAQKPRRR
ncbi:MAG: hypothetical protein LBU32_14985 [Clostridiales bacterium]|nr:hypothetical protein [Clostridiales bacterium]